MTPFAFIIKTIRYHARDHVMVLLGIAVAAAVIIGSLVIGDSVRGSLHAAAVARIGQVDSAIVGTGRFVRENIAVRLRDSLDKSAVIAPVLQVRGVGVHEQHRANVVSVCGVNESFWQLAPTPFTFQLGPREVALNRALADALKAKAGDSVLLRVEKPGFLPRDAPLSSSADTTVAMRLTVARVLERAEFGDFALGASQLATPTAFVDLAGLQQKTELEAVANLLLVSRVPAATLEQAFAAEWIPNDAMIEVRPMGGRTEVRTERIFLDPPLAAALLDVPQAAGISTYFVNELRHGERMTPYSLVSGGDWQRLPGKGAPLSTELGDDGIAINQWLANDLKADVGAKITLRYFIIKDGGGLDEAESSFTVKAIVPIEGIAADRELMPHFPGISGEEDCKNWHPGVPIHLERIRTVDEEYWDAYRGTPKAFLSRAASERIFGNRYGALTAVRVPQPPAAVTQRIKKQLTPTALGLVTVDIREAALSASSKAMDFSGLFIGLGFFLVVAALTLAGMLVALGLDRRRREVGTLLALGFAPRRVARLVLGECAAVALLGAIVGGALGIAYAVLVIVALAGGWSAAIGSASIQLVLLPGTVVLGIMISAVVAGLVLAWRVRHLHRQPVAQLVRGRGGELSLDQRVRRWPGLLGSGGMLGAVIVAIIAVVQGQSVGLFFLAGALGLAGGIGWCLSLIDQRLRRGLTHLRLGALAMANAARGGGRSVAVVITLAAACFLIIAVGANRRDPLAGAERRDAGTGGYAMVMNTAVPMAEDFNDAADRERLGLQELDGIGFTPIRVGHGDDASCLNLNRSSTPRLFGVVPNLLQDRFHFSAQLSDGGWSQLNNHVDGAIPAIGDDNTTQWSLGLSVGDRLTYRDEFGKEFTIILVGTVAHSILQGGLFIADDDFVAKFPSQGGHGMWLIDAPSERSDAVRQELERGLADFGATTQKAVDRLAAYLAVERTYLDIFLTLGGLALLLGSIGVGAVVARNVAERRGELAAAHAIGFSRSTIFSLLVGEHALLLIAGLGLGALTGGLAVYPALISTGTPVPWRDLVIALGVIVLSGLGVIIVATRNALSGSISASLRKE